MKIRATLLAISESHHGTAIAVLRTAAGSNLQLNDLFDAQVKELIPAFLVKDGVTITVERVDA